MKFVDQFGSSVACVNKPLAHGYPCEKWVRWSSVSLEGFADREFGLLAGLTGTPQLVWLPDRLPRKRAQSGPCNRVDDY